MTHRRARCARARGLRAVALALGMALVMSGCYTQMTSEHMARSPDTRPYYCNAVGDGTPPSGHGNGSHVHPIYEGMTKGPLSWEDCRLLSNQLDALLGTVHGLGTRAQGEAAGWREVGEYVPGLGTHHIKDFSSLRTFDPAKPAFLIYGGEGPDAPLVGMAYYHPAGTNPPAGFAGTNDWWHLHTKICVGPNGEDLAGGEEISDEECAALGGTNRSLGGAGHWLLHVWVAPNYQTRFDVFVSGHPCLGETGPLPPSDPCWAIVNHDPADGPLPGSGHDEHGH
jgi:hypothetical protein